MIDCNCNQKMKQNRRESNTPVLLFPFQRSASPYFDASIGLLVKLADCSRRDFGSPECLCDILDSTDRHTCRIHIDKSLLNATFTTAIAFNDSSLKGNPL